MSTRAFLFGTFILTGLAGLGIADAFLTNARIPTLPPIDEEPTTVELPTTVTLFSSSSVSSVAEILLTSSSSSSATPIPSIPGGVLKANGPDVDQTLAANQLTANPTDERSLLQGIVTDGTEVKTRVLMINGDRAGLISWVDSPKVKLYFLSLKEALSQSFSAEVRDLVDETQQPAGKPVRNLLSFSDPGIAEERLAFMRVRERLYEFHITAGSDDAIFVLIDALSK
ncbi:MAG: hypothetical protein PHH13_03215 [Candidatus Peribacteraceae bacterium]|nr:hypothetical protein [Candidatus Peribacteraceae bacterium]